MRWLTIIIVAISLISCLVVGYELQIDQNGTQPNPSKLDTDNSKPLEPTNSDNSETKNQDYELIPLPTSFLCQPIAFEGTEFMRIKASSYKYSSTISDPRIIAGIVFFVVIGFLFLFPFCRIFRLTAGLTGTIFFAYLSCLMYGHFHPDKISFSLDLIRIGAPVGVISFLVVGYYYMSAIYILPFISGWLMVIFFSTFFFYSNDIFDHFYTREVVAITWAMVLTVLVRFFENQITYSCITFLGAYFIGLGTDLALQTRLIYNFGTSICLFEPMPKYNKLNIAVNFFIICVWFIFGGLYFYFNRGRRWGVNIEDDETDEEQADIK